MTKCNCCKKSHDDQFISKYETTNRFKNNLSIKVCESCFDELSEYDEGSNMNYIYWDEECFYNSASL